MTDRTASRLAVAIFGLVTAIYIGGVTLAALTECSECRNSSYGSEGFAAYAFVVELFVFPLVGVFIASRKPRNRIGWILLGIGFVWAISVVTASYVEYGLISHPGSLPGADVALALDSAIWIPAVGLMGTFLILLFPDGRLPSPRWRIVGWLSAISLSLGYILLTFTPGSFEDVGIPVENPLGVEALGSIEWVLPPVVMLIPISFVACAAGLITRYRRSQGTERLQMKWFAAATGVMVALFFVGMVASIPFWDGNGEQPLALTILDNVGLASFVLVPLATGVAVLRYRLYDIDVIVNRALVYGSLTGILTLAYFLMTALLQGLLSPIAGESDIAVAASTLAIAALFRPVRNRVQTFIDRRFYRRKYDANRTVRDFSTRLRERVEIEALTSDLVSVVGDVMQPAHVSVWLGRSPTQ